MLDAKKGATHIDGEDAVELGDFGRHQLPEAQDRRIVHKGIDATMACDDIGDKAAPLILAADLLGTLKRTLGDLPANASDAELRQAMSPLREPLLELNKCPDFVVNRGHYFGSALPESELPDDPQRRREILATWEPPLADADKRALIEFLKTM